MNGALDTNDSIDSGTSEGGKKDAKDNGDVLQRARHQRKQCVDADATSGNMAAARDDLLFLTGGENQWPEPALRIRKADETVVLTINQMPAFLHQVTNDQRQNTPSIKVHPVDDGADVETAKVMQGLIRHIEYSSNADICYDTAVNSAAAVGFGYWYLFTKYSTPSSFNQDICFGRVRNPLSVRTDPLSIQPDGSDYRFAFIDHLMGKKDFEREWPKANANTASFIGDGASDYVGWITADNVLVCDWYEIEHEDAEAVLLSNGESGWEDKLLEMPEGVTVVKKSKRQRPKVMLRKITAVDVLEETEIKCKWIPVFPVYGDEVDVEGVVTRSGLIRNAKGPAQSYNVMMSAATQEVAMRARAPWVMAEGQEEGHEQEFAESAVRNLPYLRYKPVTLGDKLAPAPQRNAPADIPSGMLAMAMHAAENVKRATGLFSASLGERGSANSGKQELAQQREGDVANFHYYDGLLRSLRHCGRCLVDMIPSYYDTRRTIRILGEKDDPLHVTINEPNMQQKKNKDGRIPEILNDLTAGTYDVTISSGPSYTTMRQENAEFFAQALQGAKDPATAAILGYQAMVNMDAPGSQTAAKMLATLLPPPAKAVLDEESGSKDSEQEPMVQTPQGPLPASQAGQAIATLMQSLQEAGEKLKQADGAKAQAEALKQQQLVNDQQLEPGRQAVETKRLEAEIAKANAMQADAAARTKQAEVDLIRAQYEAQCAPAKAEAEVHKARATAMTAENELRQPVVMPMDPEREKQDQAERDEKSLMKIAQAVIESRPKGADLVIKAPSGVTYNVNATLH